MSDAQGGAFRPFAEHVEVKLSSDGAPWEDAVVVEVDEVQPAAMEDRIPQHATVVFHLDCAGGTVERRVSQRRVEKLSASAGVVDFDPAGQATAARWSEPHTLLCMMPSETTIQRALVDQPGGHRIELVRGSHFRDVQIQYIGQALMAECENGFVSGRLFGESMALALVSRLLNRFGTRELREEDRPARGLPAWRLRHVTQYVDDNLGSDLRMADLAAVAHMSEFHFIRLFKQSVGLSPYRYVVERRVQRGRELLARSDLPLHEISATLGFGDQSHFTTVFKKSTGLTPKQFRDIARK